MIFQKLLLKCRNQLLFLSALLFATIYQEAKAQTNVYVNPEKVIVQDFEGWGTSMVWWAEDAGDYHEGDEAKIDELAEMLINDLNFTTFRYNIGGSCDEDDENCTIQGSCDENGENCRNYNDGMNPQRTIPNMNERDRGLNQRRMLKSIAKIGQENGLPMKFETFSNSPPYWMLISGSPSGGVNGSNNLKPDQYDDFAEYLVRATGYVNEDLEPYGFEVESIEPFNEPTANWWDFTPAGADPGSQEGCSFSLQNQYKLINELYDEMQDEGSTAFIAANDNFNMSPGVVRYYQERGLTDKLERLNFHDYKGSIDNRKELRSMATALDKKLWISEGGLVGLKKTNIAYIFYMRFMDRIGKDLKYLRPDRWIDWQVMDTHPNWTAIDYYEYMENGNLVPNKRFYLMQHFTNHYNIGDEQLFTSLDVTNVLAFRSADETELSIVVVNLSNNSEEYNIDLSDFTDVTNAPVTYWLTDDADNSHDQQSDLALDGTGNLNVTMSPNSMATFVVPITGGTSSCTASTVTPSYNIDGEGAVSGTSITIDAGQEITFSPTSDGSGDWEWSGLGTSGTSREQTISPIVSGTATATFTNNCGQTSVLNFDVTVSAVDCSPTDISYRIRGEGVSDGTTVLAPLGAAVRIEALPRDGGSWSWSGCGVSSSYTNRELILYPTSDCTVTATYTNVCGTQSTLDFEIKVVIADGTYQIRNRRSGKCLTNLDGETSNGTNVVQVSCSDSEDQQWIVDRLSSDTYAISHVGSGLYMDIEAASTTQGAANIIWPDNGGDNQRWVIEHQFGEFYHIANVNSSLLLDISGRSRANNEPNIQWPDNGGGNQDWQFVPVVTEEEEDASARVVRFVDTPDTELEGERSWTFVPNPVLDGYLSLKVASDLIGSQVVVYDFSGREFYSGAILEHEQQLDVTGLEPGVYFISLNGANQEVRKLLVR